MKKLIAILCLFVGSLFITTTAQQDNKYVDVNKKDTLTINVIADNNEKVTKSTEDLSAQFTKTVENQTTVSQNLSEVLLALESGITSYTKEIEARNKTDGNALFKTFNYNPEEIKTIMRKERWLNFITWILTAMYVVWIFNVKIYIKKSDPKANYDTPQVWPLLLIQCLVNTLVAIFAFYLIQHVLTLLFNGQYFVIKELISLYS